MTKELSGRTIAQVLATSTGGVGTHVRGILDPLVGAGADVRVLGPQATQDLFAFTDSGTRFAALEIGTQLSPADDLPAARLLRAATRGAHLIHAHGLRAGALAAVANLGRRTPLVVTLHNAVDGGGRAQRLATGALARLVARSATLVIGASEDLAQRARECGAKYVLFREVAAPPLPAPSRTAQQVRDELQIADDRPILLSIGRLHEQKGYDTLLRAARDWQDHPRRPEVVIAGDGPQQDELQREIDAHQLRARLIGRRSDVAELLSVAELVLLPSVWEARSLVAQETMRAGVPLVTTTAGGMGELVGDAAATIPVGNAAALTDTVRRLLDDPAERARLGDAGRRRAAGFPTQADTARALIELYVELLGRSRYPRR